MKVKIIGFHIEHSVTQYVARHQVRRKLDPLKIAIQRAGQRFSQCGLAGAGDILQQNMSATI